MKKLLFLICIILFLVVLPACSNDERSPKQALDEENMEDVNNAEEDEGTATYEPFSSIAATDIVGWMNAGPGENPGDSYDEARIQAEVAEWPTDLEPEEYFYRILDLTAEDFREHQEFLDSIVVEIDHPSSRPDGEIDTSTPLSEDNVRSTLNIQILLDASGSMASQVNGGVKMELAKEAITEFASALPENTQVSLRVYGHKGTNTPEGKELSCATTEEVYPLGEYNKAEFSAALEQFGPTGYTPLASAIEAAGKDLSAVHEKGTESVVYVVSDGLETCGGDPVKAAEGLQNSNIEAIVNIIGFDIEASERAALEAIAEAGAGDYFRADTADELKETLRKQKRELVQAWQDWINENVDKSFEEVRSFVDPAYAHQEAALEKSKREEERQLALTYFIEEMPAEVNADEIRELVENRTAGMRQHILKEFVEVRQEAREKGLELRENVREEGYEETEKINDEGN